MIKWLLDRSEVWALLIPLTVLIWKGKGYKETPVVVYVCLAFVLNFLQDYIWKEAVQFSFSSEPGDNLFLYNISSIVRLLLFSWFFLQLKQPFLSTVKKLIPFVFLIFVAVNFLFFEKFTSLSSRIMGLETGLVLFYCILYYLWLFMQEDTFEYKKYPSFRLVTGLSIYVVVNFPIFLFYKSLSIKFRYFAVGLWDIHNIAYIVLCIFIASFFYAVSCKRY